ncbi:MAG: VRR-NUC domain-containing protein [Bacteroidaceae bacterium]|nr:VRR-NUC domain-containing protein [Oscillospiraceae bacterium]MCF0203553.1 VRR-NUC domain-containing protein [Bacteroidaceae bacterium]
MRHREHELQAACVKWWRLQYRDADFVRLLYAVPNGGKRSVYEAAAFKAEGVVAGVSDLNLDMASADGRHHGLRIEMKQGGGRQSEHQRTWQQAVERQGYRYEVVRSVDEFIALIGEYLGDDATGTGH